MLLVSYDISNDKVRTGFSKYLKKYGRRLQYSVYEIRNSQRVLKNILEEIKLRYKPKFTKTDSVVIIPICETCKKRIIRFGHLVNEEKEVIFFE